jgi:hypothetical protein
LTRDWFAQQSRCCDCKSAGNAYGGSNPSSATLERTSGTYWFRRSFAFPGFPSASQTGQFSAMTSICVVPGMQVCRTALGKPPNTAATSFVVPGFGTWLRAETRYEP